MRDISSILVIGATGMLGRPVAAELVRQGFRVRALARDPSQAAARLPAGCEIVQGDLRDAASMRRAMEDMDGAYLNLSQPFVARPPKWDADLDGTKAAIAAAREAKLKRLMRISALGVDDPRATWWVAKHKAEADRLMRDSGVPFTVFRPNWFFESLAISVVGPCVLSFPGPAMPLRWLAASDFAKQVAASLYRDDAVDRMFECQGPEPITMRDAARRFARALGGFRVHVPMPGFALRMGAKASGQLAYVAELLRFTFPIWSEVPAEVSGDALHRPTMTLEQYAMELQRSGDWPKKAK